jgi:DNA transposition AAA+ family ATPase
MIAYTIDTGVGSTLRLIIDQIIRGAGLGLARGAAGIGKTFALQTIIGELEEADIKVVFVTASPAIGGSISAFARAVLAQYGIESSSTSDAVEALADLLKGDPFSGFGRRVMFIVDEAQELKPAVLETLRSIYDRGQRARLGVGGYAFGLLLVGNDMFMGKGGNQRIASFRPLLSRVTHNMALPRPSVAEFAAFAAALFPEKADLQTVLCALGEKHGHFRAVEVATRQATILANGAPVTAAHLTQAIRMMGL